MNASVNESKGAVQQVKRKSNEQQQNGTFDSRLTQRDIEAIRLRYLDTSSTEIARVTGYNESHVRRLFMNGGRLGRAYEAYARQQQGLAQETANAVLQRAKDEAMAAIERMIMLSKDASNEAVAFKANEFLLSISGALQESTLKGLLQSKTFEQARRLANQAFEDVFGRPLETKLKFGEATFIDGKGVPLVPCHPECSPLRQCRVEEQKAEASDREEEQRDSESFD